MTPCSRRRPILRFGPIILDGMPNWDGHSPFSLRRRLPAPRAPGLVLGREGLLGS